MCYLAKNIINEKEEIKLSNKQSLPFKINTVIVPLVIGILLLAAANNWNVYSDIPGSRLVFFSTVWMIFTLFVINGLTQKKDPMPCDQKATLILAGLGALTCAISLVGLRNTELSINTINNYFTAGVLITDLVLLAMSLKSAKERSENVIAFVWLFFVWFIGGRFFITSVTGH
ncbi:hypothetical protein CGI13_20855 [Vibrio parahaemolyticus]|nr:hypothetical protein BBM21_17020 [Vibrio parahaemolyticus]TOK71730.1 hypothetical protein CGI13_20855 [Vibrio parahaemolyticus]